MIIQTVKLNDYIVARLQVEEANLTVAQAFKNELVCVIDQGHKHIIVDFEKVQYVDSSFLGSLVSALKHAMSKGTEISVVHLNEDIQNLFELIRMNKVFRIYKSLPDSVYENPHNHILEKTIHI